MIFVRAVLILIFIFLTFLAGSVFFSQTKQATSNDIYITIMFITFVLILGPFWPSKELLSNPKKQAKTLCFFIGAFSYVLAIMQILSPHPPSSSGRWAWLSSAIYNSTGNIGLTALWFSLGTYLLYISIKKLR
jgi:hypothetical protein